MKLKWSIMKQPAFLALEFFEYERKPTFMDGVRPLYGRYRTGVLPRNPAPGPATEAFNASKDQWNAKARALCSPEKETPWGKSVRSRSTTQEIRSQISLMYEDDGKSVFGTAPPPGTTIDAVQCYVNTKLTERSRLNLVVRPECCGHSLREKLTHLCLGWGPLIQQWKVMNPTLGAEGTESAIIYLGEPFDDAKVKGLICQLSGDLRQELIALNQCPFGLIKLADGIYGCDIVGDEKEQCTLGRKSQGSAGDLISTILCKAAWETAEDIWHGKNARKMTEEEEERCLRTHLTGILQELGWELED
jgi:hypothetical protein